MKEWLSLKRKRYLKVHTYIRLATLKTKSRNEIGTLTFKIAMDFTETVILSKHILHYVNTIYYK